MKKTIYEYYEETGEWIEYTKPRKGKQYGFFGTRKDGKYAELHWGDGNIVKRGLTKKRLFGWFHDTIPMFSWGDISIKKVN